MMSTPRHDDWRAIAASLRDEIASIRTPAGSTPAAASRAIKTLDMLEHAVERRFQEELDARRRRVVGPRAPERSTIYSIESSPRGDALTEIREGVARPMKVPRPLYMAVAQTVGSISEPVRFGPIHKSVEQAVGDRVAPYMVRVPLRFWSAAGLIVHHQARFAPAIPRGKFLTQARRAWRQTAQEPLRLDPSQQ